MSIESLKCISRPIARSFVVWFGSVSSVKDMRQGSNQSDMGNFPKLRWSKPKARLHFVGGICKRRFHSENTSNVFGAHV